MPKFPADWWYVTWPRFTSTDAIVIDECVNQYEHLYPCPCRPRKGK